MIRGQVIRYIKNINTSLIALQHVETYVQQKMKIIITSHDVSLWRDIWARAC